jgi:hypothetical protein
VFPRTEALGNDWPIAEGRIPISVIKKRTSKVLAPAIARWFVPAVIRTASCHCQALILECEGEPSKVSLCNCFDCQRRTGSLFSVAAFFPRAAFRHVAGETRSYCRSSATGYSVNFHSCAICGSTIWWNPERMPHLVGVAVGAFADPDFPMPTQSVWAAEKHGWLSFPASVETYERNPPPKQK